MPAEDLTITANWTVNSYTVTFVLNNGQDNIVQDIDYGEAIVAPNNPTKTHFDFAGWDSEIPATMPAHNLTITATWTDTIYTITFDTAGGSSIAAIEGIYGSAVVAPADPTKTHFDFAGWDTEIPATMPDSYLTITATWTDTIYTITFDTAGGNPIAAIEGIYGSAVVAPADPTRDGYEFGGWDNEIPATMPDSYLTITAAWSINHYTITFDADGGDAVANIPYTIESETFALPSTSKTGHTFVGWFDSQNNQYSQIEHGSHVNLALVAHYTVNNYTLTYIVESEIYSQESVAYGVSLPVPADPTKEDYEFDGWDPELPATMPAEDLTVEAVFVQFTLEIVKSLDVATVNTQAATVTTSGSVVSLVYDPDTLYLGYDWLGWYDGETQLSTDASYDYTMPRQNKTITAKFAVKGEMSNFVFTSTPSTLTITGVVDNSVKTIYVPDYVTEIALTSNTGAFLDCYQLETLRVPFVGKDRGVTTPITDATGYWAYAFRRSSNTNPDTDRYETIKNNFFVPKSLKTLILAEDVTIAGSKAFTNGNPNTTIEHVYYEGTLSDWCSISFNAIGRNPMSLHSLDSSLPSGWKKIVFHYLSTEGAVKSDLVNSYSVVGSTFTSPDDISAIRSFAFAGFDEIVNVVITSNIQTIYASVFANCTNLRNVFVEAGAFSSYDSSITASAFSGCTNLKLYIYGSESQYSNVVYKFSSINGFSDVTPWLYYENTLPTLPGYYWTFVDDSIVTTTVDGIKFYSKGGSDVAPILEPAETDISGMVPADPTKDGYEFGGWYSDYGCTEGNEFVFGTMPSGVTIVYAKWVVPAEPEPEPEPEP